MEECTFSTCNFTKNYTRIFTCFKLYKCCQNVQRITNKQLCTTAERVNNLSLNYKKKYYICFKYLVSNRNENTVMSEI